MTMLDSGAASAFCPFFSIQTALPPAKPITPMLAVSRAMRSPVFTLLFMTLIPFVQKCL